MSKDNNKNPKEYPPAVQMYLKEISKSPILSLKKEKELFKKIKKEDDDARAKIGKSYLGLVVKIAEYYLPQAKNLTFLDLIQDGNLGLFRAVKLYNWRSNYKFSTLAILSIRNSILRALADPARTIRIPIQMIEMISKYTKAKKNLLQKLGRQPLIEEIATEMGLDVDKVQYIRKISDPIKKEIPHDYFSSSSETPLFQNIKGELVLWEKLTEEDKKEIKRKDRTEAIYELKKNIQKDVPEIIELISKTTDTSKLEARQEVEKFLKEK